MKLALATLLLPAIAAHDVWPLPTSYSFGTSGVSVSPSLSFTLDDATTPNDVITGAFSRYADSIIGGMGCGDSRSLLSEDAVPTSVSEIVECKVSVSNGSDNPSLSYTTDESYSINIDEDGKVSQKQCYTEAPAAEEEEAKE